MFFRRCSVQPLTALCNPVGVRVGGGVLSAQHLIPNIAFGNVPPSILRHSRRNLIGIPKIRIRFGKDGLPPELKEKLEKMDQDRATIDALRAKGHLSPMHWRSPGEEQRCSNAQLCYGPKAVTKYRLLDPRHWLQALQLAVSAAPGIKLVHEAFQPLKPYLNDPNGRFRDTLEDTIKPALTGLSYSPANHDAFLSSSGMTQLYTPTLRAQLLDCAACLQQGSYEVRVDVDGVLGAGGINPRSQFVLLGDRSRLVSGNLLGPRTVLRQVGPSLMLADLKYDMGSVSLDRQKVTFNDSLPKDLQGMQYLIDVRAVVAGKVTISRVPPASPASRSTPILPPATPAKERMLASPQTKTAAAKKKKGGTKNRVVRLSPTAQPTKHDPTASTNSHTSSSTVGSQDSIVVDMPFIRNVSLRLASQVFAPEEYRLAADPHRITWKVADIDYMVTAQLLQRQRELAPLLDEL
ncbi:hypothetical protein BCR44DRAFT_47484 [Catenaria anguillulae PL171]|uniref:Uncharacterized protein n=1 Tax=Catenaria anguillulae PL171 TaxID=765915 RepID=A0A1Y2HUP1_9FUNG|nr:hypothetical protein BCR44DRAFT_47484 [Catenaria anguillulae PL171]